MRIYGRLALGLNLIAALNIVACSTPATKTVTVEVKVPVAVQPITPTQVPTPPPPLPKRPATLPAAADVLLSRWCDAVAYIIAAHPLLEVSAGEKPTPVQTYPECERGGGGSGVSVMKLVNDLMADPSASPSP